MDIDFDDIVFLKEPDELTLKADFLQFLLSLDAPTVIDIEGKNTNVFRVIVTLLHGNEPSGLIAIHRWLTTIRKSTPPATNLRFIICSVEAANKAPLLTHRYLDDGLDINRCFGHKKANGYYKRAKIIENVINEVSPEAVIDLHNSSGSGPAFAVSPLISAKGLSLTSFFCNSIILSSIRLGALMEQDFNCPIITVECGGANDEQAHEIAFQGIEQLAKCKSIKDFHQRKSVEIVYKPLRLKIKSDRELTYNNKNEGEEGVTLISNIEQFNYGSVHKGQMLGWIDDKGLDNLELINDVNKNVIDKYFIAKENKLLSLKTVRIFMATTNKDIAINDCLLYIVNQPTADSF